MPLFFRVWVSCSVEYVSVWVCLFSHSAFSLCIFLGMLHMGYWVLLNALPQGAECVPCFWTRLHANGLHCSKNWRWKRAVCIYQFAILEFLDSSPFKAAAILWVHLFTLAFCHLESITPRLATSILLPTPLPKALSSCDILPAFWVTREVAWPPASLLHNVGCHLFRLNIELTTTWPWSLCHIAHVLLYW